MEFDFSLFSLGTLSVLCLGIYAIVYCIRKIVENLWKSAPDNRYWRDLALPVLGILIGAVIGMVAKSFPWPDQFTTFSARALLGAVCGMASSFVYGRFKAWLKSSKSLVPATEPTTATEEKEEQLP